MIISGIGVIILCFLVGCSEADNLTKGRVSAKTYLIEIEEIDAYGTRVSDTVAVSREEFDSLKVGDAYTRKGANR